jgi:hypothetical protein
MGRHLWLFAQNAANKRVGRFEPPKQFNLKTSRAWAPKETLRDLWEYNYPGAARALL